MKTISIGMRALAVSAVLAAWGAVALVGAHPCSASTSGLGQEKFKAGDKAPELALSDLKGREFTLSSFAGQKVVLLNFWGLRCGACLDEMPYLEALHKRYAEKGVVLLGVNTDGVDAKTVIDTMTEVNIAVSYPLLTDPEFKVTDTYTNFLVPLTIVIDKAGIIRYIHTGFEKGREKEYEDALLKALGS